jgi:hypothetical protein
MCSTCGFEDARAFEKKRDDAEDALFYTMSTLRENFHHLPAKIKLARRRDDPSLGDMQLALRQWQAIEKSYQMAAGEAAGWVARLQSWQKPPSVSILDMVPEGRITDAGLIVWQMLPSTDEGLKKIEGDKGEAWFDAETKSQGMTREMDAYFLDKAPTFDTMHSNRAHHVVNGGTFDLRDTSAFKGTLWTEPRLETRPDLIWPSRSLLLANGLLPGHALIRSLADCPPSLGYLTLLEIHPAYYEQHQLTIVEHNAATKPKVSTGGIYGRKGYMAFGDEHVDTILIPSAILKNPAYVTALFTLEVTNPFAAKP